MALEPVVLNPGVGGANIGTDDIGGGINVEVIKILKGGDGVDGGLVTDANPFPVSGPLTDAELRATAVPVSGPLTDAELRANPVEVDVTALPAGLATSGNQVIEIAALTSIFTRQADGSQHTIVDALPAGLATSANQVTGNASLASIDAKLTSPVTVTGPLTDAQLRAAAVPVSGPLTDAQLRAVAVPVSAAALPLPTGAATEAKQDTGNASLASIDGKLANPLPVTGPLTDVQLRAAAVPVSGPLTDAQLRAVAVPVSAAALPLPAGAATEAKQDTGNASLASIDGKLANPLPVTGPLTDVQLRATAVSVSGPLTDAQLRAAAVPVSGPLTDVQLRATPVPTKETRSTTGTQTSVAGSATSVTLLASNANRLGASIYNDSTAILYVRFAATASTSNFSVKLFPEDYCEVPFGYTGIIDGIWASATGNARITEFT